MPAHKNATLWMIWKLLFDVYCLHINRNTMHDAEVAVCCLLLTFVFYCCLLFLDYVFVCYLLLAAACWLFDIYGGPLLPGAWCLVLVGGYLLYACCLPFVVCSMLISAVTVAVAVEVWTRVAALGQQQQAK